MNKPTSAKPVTVEGVAFLCYRIGILRYEWQADGGRLRCGANYRVSTFYAIVDDVMIPTKFRVLKNAMRAAVLAREPKQ